MEVLSAEKKYLLELELEKAINQNKVQEVFKLKEQIDGITTDSQWRKLLQLYDVVLHSIAASKAPDLSPFTGDPFDKIISSSSSLLDIRKGIEDIFEQPAHDDPNNIPIVYNFEEQLIAPRLPVGATIRHYELEYLSNLINAAYTQVTNKIPDNFCQFSLPGMTTKFVVNKKILFENYLDMYWKSAENKFSKEFLGHNVDQIAQVLARSLPPIKHKTVASDPITASQKFKVDVLINRMNGFIKKDMSNSTYLLMWVNTRLQYEDKDNFINNLPDRTWVYIFSAMLAAGAQKSVWDAIDNQQEHTPNELSQLKPIADAVWQNPAIDLVSEYAVFASYIQDLVKISDKYNQAKVYSGIPIMFADKIPVKLNITDTTRLPSLYTNDKIRER